MNHDRRLIIFIDQLRERPPSLGMGGLCSPSRETSCAQQGLAQAAAVASAS